MSKSEDRNRLYAAWVKIDDTLPWIELDETFQTKTEAHETAKEKLNTIQIKIVKVPQQNEK